ncbi:gliding motility protein RemB [Winogradskyella immobilis]|uniref:Gliding motility protein RemB n=1 Tax=Winogradskyella immobilis TaxID=2816852 RepID=A0ABS8EIG8_9FLAO|nr:gliding motility protein RemB [Winogradskyella immobilis]MCC1483010.1 gliding motility protein RemB [Winogradskyella immobilis]MCG0015105.1 gliding motility protein RemB [Winogradskyella immobilis]
MKYFIFLILFSCSVHLSGQTSQAYQKPPVFAECAGQSEENLKTCFRFQLNSFIYKNFKLPEVVTKANYKGEIKLLFEVDKEGAFQLIYTDAAYEELKTETQRVFDNLPKITPASYNGNPTFVQYSTKINIPLQSPSQEEETLEVIKETKKKKTPNPDLNAVISNELDSINASLVPYKQLEYNSQLNIPFTHTYYARFDANLNALGTNSHTASKPYLYDDVAPYYDFKAEKESLSKDVESWVGRKLWNEHMVAVQGKDYWFTIDPVLDLQVGKDTEADFGSTFNNTRGLYVQAGIGKKLNFTASVFESQGRFAQYFNEFAESLKPFGPDPAIIPGRGIAKRFNDDAFDYPVAEAYLSYSPSRVFNVQFGHGKNFIGDGYRSLFLSDVASPSPFLKTNLKFWKIKYTSTWLFLRDVRDEVVEDGAFLPKYMANHYLSWNVSKRLNIGLFESVVWNNANDRGFDVNYLNPLIIFRAIEFETGQDAGNAVVGLSAKYKYNNKVNLYGQFIIDEFSISDVRAGNQSFRNKFGFQLGAKYFNAFNVDGLLLQAEYNQVRPYTFSHNSIVLNYGHNNQSVAHLWGANFREFILIGRYNYKRWFADGKLIFGERGLDFNTPEDSFSYGGDIFTSENNRPSDTGIRIGQGNRTTVFHGELQAGYIINPVSNLKIFTNISYRNFDPTEETNVTRRSNTVWFNIGLRTDLFNWYTDF